MPGELRDRPPGQCPEQSAERILEQGMASARCEHLGARWHSPGHSRKTPERHVGQCPEEYANNFLEQGITSARCGLTGVGKQFPGPFPEKF